MKDIRLFWVSVVWVVVFAGWPGWCAQKDTDLAETMLFFVGEELDIMTLASKKAETAFDAPAVATVIDAGEIERRGAHTLAQLLETEPGFYMNRRASGTVPYLRGVQDGILFLYDGVPMTTNATRNANSLDFETPLTNIQRVEIIRGPGSVLWGADAFAGIVNIVPFKGKDIKGVEADISAGMDNYAGTMIRAGKKSRGVESFLSVYLSRNMYHKTGYTADTSLSQMGGNKMKRIDNSHYLEVTGNTILNDKLSLSGRFSDSRKEYVLNDSEALSWLGKKESPSGFLKGTYNSRFKGVDITLTGYAQYIEYNTTNVDVETEQSDWIYAGELLLQKAFSRIDQVTFGSSFRQNHVNGAPGENNFLPASLKPGNAVFVPDVEQVDYTNTLISVFSQYRRKWGEYTDSFVGMRFDSHSEYDDTLSYNMGITRKLRDDMQAKLVYGSAFRTPYPNQLIGIDPLAPEENNTANLQLLWSLNQKEYLSFTLFHSRIFNYVFEDPYGGLSFPSDLKIWGAELTGGLVINQNLDLYASVTALQSSAESIRYKIPAYTFVQPDGTKTTFYEEWAQPYDAGPQYLVSLGGSWRFQPGKMFTANFKWTGDIPYSFDKNINTGEFDVTPEVSLGLKFQEFLGTRLTLRLEADNIFNTKNHTPGVYGPAESNPLQIYVGLSYKY
jgi:outer membrane cobalamin receptor